MVPSAMVMGRSSGTKPPKKPQMSLNQLMSQQLSRSVWQYPPLAGHSLSLTKTHNPLLSRHSRDEGYFEGQPRYRESQQCMMNQRNCQQEIPKYSKRPNDQRSLQLVHCQSSTYPRSSQVVQPPQSCPSAMRSGTPLPVAPGCSVERASSSSAATWATDSDK